MSEITFDFSQCKKGIIFGGSRGIGLGFVKTLLENFPHLEIHVTTRSSSKDLLIFSESGKIIIHQIDPLDEEELKNFADKFENGSLDFIINCIGILHDETMQPEKSLRSINYKQFEKTFSVNAFLTPLIARFFEKKLSSNLSLFTSISAKVGSIEDNRMGGWYSYRASKAALNMFLKCISIEFERKKKNCIVLALHPGTTITSLSKPFIQKTQYQLHQPEATAMNLIKLIQTKSIKDNGSFHAWSGEELPW
jgi:NAD(P)-dependent dehydrogenase (short-subunit alcohol dehydrogenase family)